MRARTSRTRRREHSWPRGIGRAALASFAALLALSACNVVGPSAVFVGRTRDVCHLPRPGNNGHVLGHDVGWSTAYNGFVYWFFGDTVVDANGDGVFNAGELKPGTIARTTDADAADCVDLTYKTDQPHNASGLAVAALPPQSGEATTWPAGAVVANDTLYWFYQSVHSASNIDTGLAKVTDPTRMDSSRVGGVFWPQGTVQFTNPMMIDGYVYLFGYKALPATPPAAHTQVLLARVAESGIERVGSYRYWNGSGWISDLYAAKPIFEDRPTDASGGWVSTLSVAYNPGIGRFVALYTCELSFGVCARTSASTGQRASSLTGGWNDAKVLWNCPSPVVSLAYGCYQAYQHTAYADSTHQSRVYVTTARHDGGPLQRYWVTMREVDLTSSAPSSSREFPNAEEQFGSTQGGANWWYLARNADGSGLPLMTWNSTSKQWELLPSSLDQDGATPSLSKDALRLWTAPAAGTVEISGEAWVEKTCGDGVDVEIYVLRVNAGTSQSLWSRRLSATWLPGRSATFDIPNVPLSANDQVKFRVGHGPATKDCDRTFFNPTMVYNRS